MSVILSINRTDFGVARRIPKQAKKNTSYCSILHMKKCSEKRSESFGASKSAAGSKFRAVSFVLAMIIALMGMVYLYQVNDLANKGFEMKEAENKIVFLKKENEKNKIQEMELRSMYNIEKIARNLDLVASKNIKYLEIESPVAIK